MRHQKNYPSELETFLPQLGGITASLNSLTDFESIKRNINKISDKLNKLNYLLGKENLKLAIEELFQDNPEVFSVLGELLGVQDSSKKIVNRKGEVVLLNSYFQTSEGIYEFMEGTGLATIIRNKQINNLVDYVFGLEVGLDKRLRGKRNSSNMANVLSYIFDGAKIFYKRNVPNTDFPQLINLILDTTYIFDFAIKTKKTVYLVETSYHDGGKLRKNKNSVSYITLAEKIRNYEDFVFVWITDGQSWHGDKRSLNKAFDFIWNIYNLSTIGEFIEKIKSEEVVPF